MNKNEYARSNKEWLAGKAKEDGVTQLAKGVCYKVLQSGLEGGKQPTPNSVVSCHYLGRTIDGKCFDMLRTAITLVCRKVILWHCLVILHHQSVPC